MIDYYYEAKHDITNAMHRTVIITRGYANRGKDGVLKSLFLILAMFGRISKMNSAVHVVCCLTLLMHQINGSN